MLSLVAGDVALNTCHGGKKDLVIKMDKLIKSEAFQKAIDGNVGIFVGNKATGGYIEEVLRSTMTFKVEGQGKENMFSEEPVSTYTKPSGAETRFKYNEYDREHR